jgi:tetratricopeptide (TPR) repeat protein
MSTFDDRRADLRRQLRRGVVVMGLASVVITAAIWWFWPGESELVIDGVLDEVSAAIAPTYYAAMEDPESADKWGELGMVLLENKVHSRARDCLEKAHKLDPSEYKWPYLIGISLSGDYPSRAIPYLETAVELRDEPVARIRLAELLVGFDRLDEAEQHLQTAMSEQPDALHALNANARLHLARGNLEEAKANAEKALMMYPGVRLTHEMMAQIYRRLGERESALKHLARAEQLPRPYTSIRPGPRDE